jgi:xylose isomerase
MLEDGKLTEFVDQRYAGWQGPLGKDILAGKLSLAQLFERVTSQKVDPVPHSGRQEMLENLIQRYRV